MAGTSPKGASSGATFMERTRSIWKRATRDRAVKWTLRYIIFALASVGTAETLREALDRSPLVPRFTLYVLLVVLIVLLAPFWIHGHLRRKKAAWWEVALVAGLLFTGGIALWKAWLYYNGRLAALTPDVALRFVNPQEPLLLIENVSGAVAKDIKWFPLLWDVDSPADSRGLFQPLPIPTTTFDWLRPHGTSIPENLFSRPTVASELKPGDEVYGSVSVTCPDCARGRTYILALRWGEGGRYSEYPRLTDGRDLQPLAGTKDGIAGFIQWIEANVPASARLQIKALTPVPP